MSAKVQAAAAAAALEGLFEVPEILTGLRNEVADLRKEVASLRRLMPPNLVSVTEAASRLGLTNRTVRRHVEIGKLKAIKVGSSIRIDLGELQQALLMTAEDVIADM